MANDNREQQFRKVYLNEWTPPHCDSCGREIHGELLPNLASDGYACEVCYLIQRGNQKLTEPWASV